MPELEITEYADWVRDRLDASLAAAHEIARVISVARDRYVLARGKQEAAAELSGNYLYRVDSAVDLPTTGDWVYADFYDADSQAVIHGLAPRRTLLRRKTPGKRVEFQLIAANIDIAFILQSADGNFNLRRLERYLVMVNESNIAPVILLSKCDLASGAEIDGIRARISSVAPGTAMIASSSVRREGIDAIGDYLHRGVTCCLLGSSGVGKTTLLNSLVGDREFATQSVSNKHGKGRHTTTSRELIELENGAMIIDTPGMRELGNISVDAGIDSTFAEVAALARDCRFADCSHTREKGCAMLAALESGTLSRARFQNYMKMKQESAFNAMSYADKRKKDRAFGRMVNAAVKNKRR